MYDIRKICYSFPQIHSRYYVDTNGVIFTSFPPWAERFMVDNIRISLKNFKNQHLSEMDKHTNMLKRYKNTDYFLLYDGTILKRLKTNLKEDNIMISLHHAGINESSIYDVKDILAKCFKS